jgi:predicted transcriptional regulator
MRNIKKPVRLSLDLAPEMSALIDDLARRSSTSKSDVLRRAISMMELAVDARERKQLVGIASDRDKLDTVFVGF